MAIDDRRDSAGLLAQEEADIAAAVAAAAAFRQAHPTITDAIWRELSRLGGVLQGHPGMSVGDYITLNQARLGALGPQLAAAASELGVSTQRQVRDDYVPPAGATWTARVVDSRGTTVRRVFSDGLAVDPEAMAAAGWTRLPDTRIVLGGPPQLRADQVAWSATYVSQPITGSGPSGREVHPTTEADVVYWFMKYLDRRPAWEEVAGRLGVDSDEVEAEIANSDEAKAVAASKGVPPTSGPGAPAAPPTSGPGPYPTTPGGLAGPSTVPTTVPGLDQTVQEVLADVLGRLGQLHAQIDQVAAAKEDEVNAIIRKIAPNVDKVAASIAKAAANAVDQILPGVGNIFLSAFADVEALFSAFLNSAADVDDVAGAFAGVISGNANPIYQFIVGTLLSAGGGIAKQTLDALAADRKDPPPPPRTLPLDDDDLGPELVPTIPPVFDPNSPIKGFAETLYKALGVLTGLLAILEPGAELTRQVAWATVPIRIPEPGSLIGAQVRGYLSPAAAEQLALRHGLGPDAHAIEVELAKTRTDAGTLLELMRRGEIDRDELERGLKRLGFDQLARAQLERAARRLIGLDTIAVLSDRLAQSTFPDPTFTGVDEMPAEFVREASAAGLKAEDVRRAWDAHYRAPDPALAAQLLHLRKIPPEAYHAAVRASGLPPVWRAAIEAAVYNPYGRRDWLRLVKLGLIDHAGLVASIMDNGYDAQRAEVLATMIEKLGAEDRSAEQKRIRAGMTKSVVELYQQGARPRQVAHDWLIRLGNDEDEVEAFLNEADFRRELDYMQQAIKAVRPLYVSKEWDWPRASNALAQADVGEDHQAQLQKVWDLERELAELKPHQVKARDLTIGELTEAFVLRAIDERTFRARLTQLHIPDEDLDVYVFLALHRQAKEELADKVDEVHHLVVTHQIAEGDASARLDKLLLPPGKRDRYLDTWLREPKAKHTDLTIAQLTDALSRELMTEEEVDEYLLILPYTDRERSVIGALIGSKAAEAEARRQAAADKASRRAAAAAAQSAP